ncbi:MAG: hypothetical protein CMH79_02040 [Nitrospinae bacterium]|nr:hypothetical protein [Nitrospinota bacterium]
MLCAIPPITAETTLKVESRVSSDISFFLASARRWFTQGWQFLVIATERPIRIFSLSVNRLELCASR